MSKRIIGISTIGYNIDGNRTFYLAANTEESMNAGSRRVTRTKTLDGSAVAYDAGYSVADITWMISVEARSALVGNWIAWMVKTYNLIKITTKDGVFKCVPSRWTSENGKVVLEAWVMEKLA
jgi:hypothetical protein